MSANITLNSFRSLLGRVNDGQFILQGEGDAQTLERVNRGQNFITQNLRWKKMDLSGHGVDNKRTREALLNAIAAAQNKQEDDQYIQNLRVRLGLDEDATAQCALDVRFVKQLIDEIDGLGGESREEVPENGEGNGSTVQEERVEEVPPPEENPETEGTGSANDRKEENPPPGVNAGDPQPPPPQENTGTSVSEEEMPKPEEVPAEHEANLQNEKDVAALEEKVVQMRASVKDKLMDQCREFVKGLLDDVRKGTLRLFVDGKTGETSVPVEGLVQYILETSLEENGVDYYRDGVEDLLNRLLAGDADPKDPAELNRKLDALAGEIPLDDVKALISSRLKTMADAVPAASQKNGEFKLGDVNQFGSVLKDAKLPSVNGFLEKPSRAFANHRIRAFVADQLPKMKDELLADIKGRYGVMTEDPGLVDDCEKAFDQAADTVKAQTQGDLKGPVFGTEIDGLKDKILASFQNRLDTCQKRHFARHNLLAQTGVLTHVQELLAKFSGRIPEEVRQQISDFTSNPPPAARDLIEGAIERLVGQKEEVNVDDIGQQLKDQLDAIIETEHKKGMAMFDAQVREELGKFAEILLTPGSDKAMSSLDVLRPLVDANVEVQKGVKDGPFAQLMAQIKEKAFGLAFEKARAKADALKFLPADAANPDFRREISNVFHNEFQRALYCMHHMVNCFDKLVDDKDFHTSVEKIGLTNFKSKKFLWKSEWAKVNKCLEGLRTEFVLSGADDENVDMKEGIKDTTPFAAKLLSQLTVALAL